MGHGRHLGEGKSPLTFLEEVREFAPFFLHRCPSPTRPVARSSLAPPPPSPLQAAGLPLLFGSSPPPLSARRGARGQVRGCPARSARRRSIWVLLATREDAPLDRLCSACSSCLLPDTRRGNLCMQKSLISFFCITHTLPACYR
jgi:hypothetical protein